MPKLGEAYVNIRANLSPLRHGLAMARTAVASSMGFISGTIRRAMNTVASAVRKTMEIVKTTIKRAMLVSAAGITLAVREAAKFEAQLNMVATMLSANVTRRMAAFKADIVALAKRFGESTQTLTKGLYDILSASISVFKAMDVLTVAVKAAKAGMTDTAVSADVITTVLNSYGMGADHAAEVSDKLFATVKRGKTTFEQLAGSLGKAAATSAIAGLSLEQLLAIIATATRAGVRIDEAMTSVVGTLSAFLKPSKDGAEVAKKYGVELSSAWLKANGLTEAIRRLNKASAEELMTLIQNRRAFKALAAALKDTKGFMYDVTLITHRYRGMTEEARKKTEGFNLSLRRTWEHIKALSRTLGEPLLEPLGWMLEQLRGVFEGLEKWVARNSATITRWGYNAGLAVRKVISYIKSMISVTQSSGLTMAINLLFQDIHNGIIKAYRAILDKMPAVKTVLEDAARAFAYGIKQVATALFPIFEDAARRLIAELQRYWPRISDELRKAFAYVVPYAERLGAAIWRGFVDAMKKPLSAAKKSFAEDLPADLRKIAELPGLARDIMGARVRGHELEREYLSRRRAAGGDYAPHTYESQWGRGVNTDARHLNYLHEQLQELRRLNGNMEEVVR